MCCSINVGSLVIKFCLWYKKLDKLNYNQYECNALHKLHYSVMHYSIIFVPKRKCYIINFIIITCKIILTWSDVSS